MILMKKKQKLTLKPNGQIILTIPADLNKEISTDKQMIAEYRKEKGKFIIELEEVQI